MAHSKTRTNDGKITYPPGVKEISDKISKEEMVRRLKVSKIGFCLPPPPASPDIPLRVWGSISAVSCQGNFKKQIKAGNGRERINKELYGFLAIVNRRAIRKGEAQIFYGLLWFSIKKKIHNIHIHFCLQKVVSYEKGSFKILY